MAITRNDYLAEQLHRLLSGGDIPRDSPWSRAELLLLVTQAQARVIQGAYWENLKAGGDHSVDGQLTVAFNGLPLVEDAKRREWVATLPNAYMGLPGGRGIQRVRFAGRLKEHDLIPAPLGLLSGTRVAKALGSTYEVVGLEIRVNPSCALKATDQLDVRLVMAGGGSMPQEMELATLAEAFKMAQARQKPDLTNDQNPTV